MYKFVFLLAAAALPARASTCGSLYLPGGATGTATCGDASATVGGEGVSAEAFASGSDVSSAAAQLTGEFDLTVFGGTGQGYFAMCAAGQASYYAEPNSQAQAFISLGPLYQTATGGAMFGCGVFTPSDPTFTYGVPQELPFLAWVSVTQSGYYSSPGFPNEAQASASLMYLQFFDSSGSPINPSVSENLIPSISGPEPSAGLLVGAGLLLGCLRRISRRP